MSHDLIDELRAIHERTQMVGWDFSRLEGRLVSDEQWWDFEADCLDAMRSSSEITDLGTGGGERLIRLIDELPDREARQLVATEGWKPNVPEARENLAPYGVKVYEYDPESGETMPFDDGSFDLVLSRHEGIDAAEVARVLAPGGRFLTQQVEAYDAEELHDWFGAEYLYPEVTAPRYEAELESAGLHVDTVDEWSGTMEFADVQALVTYIGLVPWDVPGFTVDDHSDKLRELAEWSSIRVSQRRFRVYATMVTREQLKARVREQLAGPSLAEELISERREEAINED